MKWGSKINTYHLFSRDKDLKNFPDHFKTDAFCFKINAIEFLFGNSNLLTNETLENIILTRPREWHIGIVGRNLKPEDLTYLRIACNFKLIGKCAVNPDSNIYKVFEKDLPRADEFFYVKREDLDKLPDEYRESNLIHYKINYSMSYDDFDIIGTALPRLKIEYRVVHGTIFYLNLNSIDDFAKPTSILFNLTEENKTHLILCGIGLELETRPSYIKLFRDCINFGYGKLDSFN